MSVTPDFVGQRYKDTTNGNIWIANSTTAGDWTLEVQNMQVSWFPRGIKAGEHFFLSLNGTDSLPGVTSITLNQAVMVGGFDFGTAEDLVSISAPNLTSVDPDEVYPNGISFYSCPSLVSVSAPLLEVIGNGIFGNDCPLLQTITLTSLQHCLGYGIEISGNTSLVELSLPSLISIADKLDAAGCSSLTTVAFQNFLPTNGKNLTFSGCALSQSSVNHILARCVANAAYQSGIVNTSGGTSAAPSGQGAADKTTLQARGVTVTTN